MNFLIQLVASIFKAWFGEQNRTQSDQALGAAKQAKATEEAANAQTAKATAARDNVVPLDADSLRDIPKGSDPDFRD